MRKRLPIILIVLGAFTAVFFVGCNQQGNAALIQDVEMLKTKIADLETKVAGFEGRIVVLEQAKALADEAQKAQVTKVEPKTDPGKAAPKKTEPAGGGKTGKGTRVQ